jgi:hypothetical protein
MDRRRHQNLRSTGRAQDAKGEVLVLSSRIECHIVSVTQIYVLSLIGRWTPAPGSERRHSDHVEGTRGMARD